MVKFFDFLLRWYIICALLAAGMGGCLLLIHGSGLEDYDGRNPNSIYSGTIGKAWECLNSQPGAKPGIYLDNRTLNRKSTELTILLFVKILLDYFPQYVLMPATIVGFGGWTLDVLCRFLYKKLQALFPKPKARGMNSPNQ
jgi:hypothetical protein